MNAGTEDVITAEAAVTLDGLFRQRLHRSPDRPAYRSYDKDANQWVDVTWSQTGAAIARWQEALASEGLAAGDRVALAVRNCWEWVLFEQAALGLGLVVVPLYTDDRPDNVAYILRDAAVRVLLVGDVGLWQRLAPAVLPIDHVQRVLILDCQRRPAPNPGDQRVLCVEQWLVTGEAVLRQRSGDPHELATIVYTSGTTGRPKGVMLSHHNILSIAHSALASYDVYVEDVLLSFLPLSHSYERTVGYYLPMMAGATVAYARSIQQLPDDLRQVRPTVLIAVPRIFERIYTKVQEQLAKKSPVARKLFQTTVAVGWKRFQSQQGRKVPGPSQALWPILDRLVARKIRDRLGGRTRMIVSGGAPLPVAVSHTFIGLGLPILQGYGMTETSPVVSGNLLDDNEPASVGQPLRNVEVRIGADDELLVRGPGVMLGYWNNHAATAQTIDSDGWLHSGDRARIDGEHIYIIGRIKDILVLSNGEKVPPGDVEAALCADPLFEQAMVVGEGKSYLSALVVLNPDLWIDFAEQLALDPFDRGSLEDERVHRHLLKRMRDLMHDFPGYAKIRRLHLSLEPWDVESGLLTPTLKLRRDQVLERFQQQMKALYE